MQITIDVPDGRVARKIREHGLEGIDNAAELLAESVFYLPAEDSVARLLGTLARTEADNGAD